MVSRTSVSKPIGTISIVFREVEISRKYGQFYTLINKSHTSLSGMRGSVTTENSCHFLPVKEKFTLAGYSWTDTQRNESKSSHRSAHTSLHCSFFQVAKQ